MKSVAIRAVAPVSRSHVIVEAMPSGKVEIIVETGPGSGRLVLPEDVAAVVLFALGVIEPAGALD